MAMTPKQDRNGVSGPDSTRNTAQPGPNAESDIRSAMASAQAAGNQRKAEARTELLDTPAGSGVAGHTIGAGGNIWSWDSGLAINDVEGGGSG